MSDFNFNRKQCTGAIKKLGFVLKNKRSGKHDKYVPPQEIAKKLTADQPHFIMIPRHGELRCQLEIISELRVMGGETLVEAFKQYL